MIREKYPDIGQPFVCPDGYAEIKYDPIPVIDEKNQVYHAGTPENRNGEWFIPWVIVDLVDGKNPNDDSLVLVKPNSSIMNMIKNT